MELSVTRKADDVVDDVVVAAGLSVQHSHLWSLIHFNLLFFVPSLLLA
jgi:hypothetical protein